jgi:integral membrane protein
MKNNFPLTLFRWVAISEGISYLALLSNMLFIKPSDLVLYKSLLYPIGMTHGVLFIGYIVLAILLKKSQKWSLINLGIILFASLLPFATFVIERKYLKRDIHVDK